MESSLIRASATKEFLNDGYAHDPCHVHGVIDPGGGCSVDNFDPNSTLSCGDAGFVYSQDFYPETLSTRFLIERGVL